MSLGAQEIRRHADEKRRLVRLYKRLNGVIPIVTVSVVVRDGRRVLVARRVNEPLKGRYCLVGGALHYAERSEDAAVRKAFEESGLRVRVERLIGVYSFVYTGKIKRHNLDITFLARKVGGRLKKDEQHTGLRFIGRLDEVKLPAYVKQAIIDSGVIRGTPRPDFLRYRFFLQRT